MSKSRTIKKSECCGPKPFFMREALELIPTTDEDTPVVTNNRLRPDGSDTLRPDGTTNERP